MKASFLALAAVAALTFTSCKKDYTCTCNRITKTTNTDGSTTTTQSQESQYVFKDSEARAATKCNDKETTGTDALGRDYSIECDI